MDLFKEISEVARAKDKFLQEAARWARILEELREAGVIVLPERRVNE